MVAPKTRYAQIGTGGRAQFFYSALVTTFKDNTELVAFADTNQTRMDFANKTIKGLGHPGVPTYKAVDFEKMIKETKPDIVLVTSIDRTHDYYLIRAMELGCDVISEKPMTIDEKKCQAIIDAQKRTGRNLRVTFNYRYSPHNTKIKEILDSGVIGKVNSVHFEWLLNTQHGADYFRRWHRNKCNSGGLLVHKSTHHFDLVNFWLGAKPETAFAFGDLKFYGKINAEKRGETFFPYRSHGNIDPKDENDKFSLDLNSSEALQNLYLNAEHEDGYYRDLNVFGDGIDIEDTLAVMVKYNTGAFLTYSLTAYAPWEGFRISFNGPKGRLEATICEISYVNSGGLQEMEGALQKIELKVCPNFEEPYLVEVVQEKGGHGGGDPILLRDLFGPADKPKDPLNRAATQIDGAMSIMTGIACNKALRTGLPVQVQELVNFNPIV